MSTAPGGSSRRLLLRLLTAYLLPSILLLTLFSALVYRATQARLESALGRHLVGIAEATAQGLRPAAIEFLAPGDDDTLTARRLRGKLARMKEATGTARLTVIDSDFKVIADTDEASRIGEVHYLAAVDRHEIMRVFLGESTDSVLFSGPDGELYKTGYAPVKKGSGVVAAVAAQGRPRFFDDLLALRAYLVVAAAAMLTVLSLVTILSARRITRPLGRLADEAARIGAGDLSHPIRQHSRDEVGLLARTMNTMRVDLLRRDQRMQMMLAGVAHEVRNPLGGITLLMGLLRDETQDHGAAELIERVELELGNLQRITVDFLDFARRQPLQTEEVDLRELVEEVAASMCADATAARVKLATRAENAPTLGNRDRLRAVLINLVRNAIQASSADATVELRCGHADGCVYVEVQDSGDGIPGELLDKVQEPFFTTKEKGTGLGLALCKKTMDEHRGRLLISSMESRGTTVRVELPMLAVSEQRDRSADGQG